MLAYTEEEQCNRPGMLGPVDPEELHDPVYFEVKIIHLNVYIDVYVWFRG